MHEPGSRGICGFDDGPGSIDIHGLEGLSSPSAHQTGGVDDGRTTIEGRHEGRGIGERGLTDVGVAGQQFAISGTNDRTDLPSTPAARFSDVPTQEPCRPREANRATSHRCETSCRGGRRPLRSRR